MTIFLVSALQECDCWHRQAGIGTAAVQCSKGALWTPNGVRFSAWFQTVALRKSLRHKCSASPGGTEGGRVCLLVCLYARWCKTKLNGGGNLYVCERLGSAGLYQNWISEEVQPADSTPCSPVTLKWPPAECKTLWKFLIIPWTPPRIPNITTLTAAVWWYTETSSTTGGLQVD